LSVEALPIRFPQASQYERDCADASVARTASASAAIIVLVIGLIR
jgi:hypothetical protein